MESRKVFFVAHVVEADSDTGFDSMIRFLVEQKGFHKKEAPDGSGVFFYF